MPGTKEREKLAEVIRQWNSNRLDLFEISQPDEVRHLGRSERQAIRDFSSATTLSFYLHLSN